MSASPKAILGLGSAGQIAAVALLLGAGLVAVNIVNSYYVFVLANVALFAIVGIGLNVLQGLTGQVSFGHVGFYAIGAYTVGILTSKAGWSFWEAWPVAAALAGVMGVVLALPALRVKGPYLAMITVAFGFIIEHGVIELRGLTGGHNGIMNIPAPTLPGGAGTEQSMATIALLTVGVSLVLFAWLSRGTWGAAMRAVRDSETAAESVGINPLVVKTVAFSISAVAAGLAGGLFAPLSGFVAPSAFGFGQSILFVLVVILGGAGAVGGPLLGALIVALLPELLSSMEEYRLLFFGVLLLLALWVAPAGALGLWATLKQRLSGGPASGSSSAQADGGAGLPWAPRERRPLAAQRLSMQFGGVRAVSDLSFDAAAGRITSLIGPNGAGKTTALNMLSGYYVPTGGSFTLGGERLAALPSHAISRRGVARTYQTSQLFGSLDVESNVALGLARGRLGPLFGAAGYRAPALRARARGLLAFCGYRGDGAKLAGDLAHVDKRLVEIARALATDPEMLLLDEPGAGLSREDKDNLASLLQRIAAAGIGVLVVEHDMTLVMSISNQIVVLDAGLYLAAGTPAAVQADPRVKQAYLGESLDTTAGASRGNARAKADPPREMLGVGALVASYGAEPVLHGVDLQVQKGEVVALLGANGAGKSTLMRALSGLHRPVQGGIHLEGTELSQLAAELVVRRGLVLVPEGRQVFPELSVRENIRLGAFTQPDEREPRVEEMFHRFPRLRERQHQRAGLLSGGEQQMLAIARGLMSRPRILLLDEPSLGLAPKLIAELFAALDALREEGMTVLLVDQMASLALALADRAYVIEGGRIVAQGTAAEIAQDDALARTYLGVQDEPVPPVIAKAA
ncbi:branched-chain amino acid ABC transporter ATP-binding protein/permease [Variovorax ginsengisoli]|uniref:ATP-binding cassette domain-containing protein n=1 Tax=Variovorax ginsengisoli TaxID=363844 RepID=A0ABT8SFQ3_9BURK|nr:ATP-binding cassette domain-containing protein [Variovorax ginsengisoli]MDN8618593.1 ATP-binding cassette domain-containing protein [Variovorax ginsengisoli]MDO1537763.1 ATP-binding cassette domain-containing protein [Variovorax ginsengisoli]